MDHVFGVADAMLAWLAGLDPWLVFLVAGVFTALETTILLGLLVPGDVVVLLAGSTVTTAGEYLMVVLWASGGALVGESGGYLIGRAFGPRLRESWLGRRIGAERWMGAERYLAGRGAAALVPVRFVAILHAVAPLVAGAVRMPYGRFIAWSALAAVIWSVLYTGVGVLAGASYREFGHVSLVGTAVAAGALGAVLLVAGRRRGNRLPRSGR
jgi:membrane-associated protein